MQINLHRINWSYIIIAILCVVIFFLFNSTTKLEGKLTESETKAKEHEIKAQFYLDIYHMQLDKDTVLLAKYDSLLLEKNKTKILYNEKIKIINRYSVSDMQLYFNERTN